MLTYADASSSFREDECERGVRGTEELKELKKRNLEKEKKIKDAEKEKKIVERRAADLAAEVKELKEIYIYIYIIYI